MSKQTRQLKTLTLGIALSLGLPALALAEQGQSKAQSERTQSERMQSSDRMYGDTSQQTQERTYSRQSTAVANRPIEDRPGQTAKDARREAVIWTSYSIHDTLGASDIDVEVKNGKAILKGTVDSDIERELAADIAESVSGIRDVDNQLNVDPNYRPTIRRIDVFAVRDYPDRELGEDMRNFGTRMKDATTTAQVKSKLLWNDNTSGMEIDVDTRFGRVTLTGDVTDRQAKTIAEQLARDTQGVVAVRNQLNISPDAEQVARSERQGSFDQDMRQTSRQSDEQMTREDSSMQRPDSWVTTKVKSSLLFSRSVDGFDIEVDTQDGLVTLSGNVATLQEKQRAVELAGDIVGVRQVDASQLQVRRADEGTVAEREQE